MIFKVVIDSVDKFKSVFEFLAPYSQEDWFEVDSREREFLLVYIPDGLDVSVRNEFCLFFYKLGD